MPEEIVMEETQAVKETPPKTRLSPRGPLMRRALPLAAALAVLISTSAAVGLGHALEQTRAELNQLYRSPAEPPPGTPPAAAAPAEPEPEAEPEEPGPERPAYQELYPELYAQSHEWNSVVKSKVCYLTFDDGPSARTPEVLKILDRYGVKATFFAAGKDTEQTRQWMRDIVEAGHTIGVHSYTHSYRTIYSSVEAFLDDFAKEYHLIEEATGTAPQIFRFPGGSINAYNGQIYQEIVSEMVRRGFVYFDWNRSNGDAVSKPPSAAALAKNALDRLGKSSRVILLMHDSKGHGTTVASLPAVIEGYLNAGYSLEALTPEVKPIVYAYPNP